MALPEYTIEYKGGTGLSDETVKAADVSVRDGWLIAADDSGVVLQVPQEYILRVARV